MGKRKSELLSKPGKEGEFSFTSAKYMTQIISPTALCSGLHLPSTEWPYAPFFIQIPLDQLKLEAVGIGKGASLPTQPQKQGDGFLSALVFNTEGVSHCFNVSAASSN